MLDPIEAIKEAEYQAKATGQRQAVVAMSEGYAVVTLAKVGRRRKLEVVNPPKRINTYTRRQKLLMSPVITFSPIEGSI